MSLRGLGLLVIAMTIALVPTSPVRADHHLGCRYVGDQLVCSGEDDPTPPPTRPTPGPPESPPESPYYYTTEPAIGPCPGPGEVYTWIHTHLRATGEIISSTAVCLGPADPPAPTPPPPPPPPTQGEFVQEIEHLLQLETELSPPADGLGGVSQLDTWLWCDNDGDVTVDISLSGWRATATASITLLTWTMDGPDGAPTATATECGNEPDPESDGGAAAATWTPNEPGNHSITLTAEWGGTWTRSFGGVSQSFDLGTVTVSNPSIPYAVVEIQTVGIDNR